MQCDVCPASGLLLVEMMRWSENMRVDYMKLGHIQQARNMPCTAQVREIRQKGRHIKSTGPRQSQTGETGLGRVFRPSVLWIYLLRVTLGLQKWPRGQNRSENIHSIASSVSASQKVSLPCPVELQLQELPYPQDLRTRDKNRLYSSSQVSTFRILTYKILILTRFMKVRVTECDVWEADLPGPCIQCTQENKEKHENSTHSPWS